MQFKWNYFRNTIFFFVIFFLLAAYFSRLMVPKDNMEQYGMQNVSANGILAEKPDSIDVLFLGDSLVYSSISPMKMYENQGFTSYLCSTPAQPLYYTKNLLERTLKTQSPKVVLLEADAIFRDFDLSAPFVQEIQDLFPLFEYHDRWKNLQLEDWLGNVRYTYNNSLKGSRLEKDVQPIKNIKNYMDNPKKIEEIPWINYWILDSIVNSCKEKNCELVFFSTPSYTNWNWKRHDSVQKYCDEKSIPYIDLNTDAYPITIDWTKDTRDKGDHLNYSGALKVTSFMEKYLKQNYELPDHRSDPSYHLWNEAIVSYKKVIKALK